MATDTKAIAEAGSDRPLSLKEIRSILIRDDKQIAKIDKQIKELRGSLASLKAKSAAKSRRILEEARAFRKLAKKHNEKIWIEISRIQGVIAKMAKEAAFYNYMSARKRVSSINASRDHWTFYCNRMAKLKVRRSNRLIKINHRAAALKEKIQQEAIWRSRVKQFGPAPEIRVITPSQYNELIAESARKLLDQQRIYGFKDTSGKETKEEG